MKGALKQSCLSRCLQLVLHIGALVWITAALFLIPFPANVPEKAAADCPNTWAVGDVNGVLVLLGLVAVPAAAAI